MTLLRYSHHGTGNRGGEIKSAATVIKLAGAKKSWTNRNSSNKRALLTTAPGVTTPTTTMKLHHTTKPFQHFPSKLHRNIYHWNRSPHEYSFIIEPNTETQRQRPPHARNSVWRRAKNHDNAKLQHQRLLFSSIVLQ
jgi:hypothetical protein